MNEQPSTARTAIKWGAFLGLALIVITLVMYLADQASNPVFSGLTLAAMAAFLVFAMRDFRSLNSGYMTYGEGLSIGALSSAIAGLMSSAFSTFYNVVIDPTIQQKAFDTAREKMETQGTMSDEQMDQAMEIAQKFQSPGFTFVAGVFGALLVGFLLSLIIAAFMRKNKINPFE